MTKGGAREGAGRPRIGTDKMVSVSLSLPEETVAMLRLQAAKAGVSLSEAARRALDNYGGTIDS